MVHTARTVMPRTVRSAVEEPTSRRLHRLWWRAQVGASANEPKRVPNRKSIISLAC